MTVGYLFCTNMDNSALKTITLNRLKCTCSFLHVTYNVTRTYMLLIQSNAPNAHSHCPTRFYCMLKTLSHALLLYVTYPVTSATNACYLPCHKRYYYMLLTLSQALLLHVTYPVTSATIACYLPCHKRYYCMLLTLSQALLLHVTYPVTSATNACYLPCHKRY